MWTYDIVSDTSPAENSDHRIGFRSLDAGIDRSAGVFDDLSVGTLYEAGRRITRKRAYDQSRSWRNRGPEWDRDRHQPDSMYGVGGL